MGGVWWGHSPLEQTEAASPCLSESLTSPEFVLLFPLNVKTVFKEKWLSSSGKRLTTLISISATSLFPFSQKPALDSPSPVFKLEAARGSCRAFALPPFTMAQKGTVSQALLQEVSHKIVLRITFRTVDCMPKSLAFLWVTRLSTWTAHSPSKQSN